MWAKYRLRLACGRWVEVVGGGVVVEGHIEPKLTEVLSESEQSCVELVPQDKTRGLQMLQTALCT